MWEQRVKGNILHVFYEFDGLKGWRIFLPAEFEQVYLTLTEINKFLPTLSFLHWIINKQSKNMDTNPLADISILLKTQLCINTDSSSCREKTWLPSADITKKKDHFKNVTQVFQNHPISTVCSGIPVIGHHHLLIIGGNKIKPSINKTGNDSRRHLLSAGDIKEQRCKIIKTHKLTIKEALKSHLCIKREIKNWFCYF